MRSVVPLSGYTGPRNHAMADSLGRRLLARLAVGLLDRLGGEVGGLGGELGGAVVGDLVALELSGDLAQALADLAQADVHAAFSRSRTTAPRMPLTNPGASAPQYSLASSTASLIATSGGVSVYSIS